MEYSCLNGHLLRAERCPGSHLVKTDLPCPRQVLPAILGEGIRHACLLRKRKMKNQIHSCFAVVYEKTKVVCVMREKAIIIK